MWRFKTGKMVHSRPVEFPGAKTPNRNNKRSMPMVIFGSDDGWVYGLCLNTGEQIWKSEGGTTGRGHHKHSSPALVYRENAHDSTQAAFISTGEGEASIDADGTAIENSIQSTVTLRSNKTFGVVVMGSGWSDEHVYALAAHDGRLLWQVWYRSAMGALVL